jgi:hypothetical protein
VLRVSEVKPDVWCTVQFFWGEGWGHYLWVLSKDSCGSKMILGTLTEEVVAEIANDSDSDISSV